MSEFFDYPKIWKVTRHEGIRRQPLFDFEPVLFNLTENADFSPNWQETAIADENGTVIHEFLRNGWAYSEYESKESQTVLLEANGTYLVFVNGEPFIGDEYSLRIAQIPIPLKQGVNRFFVRALRETKFEFRLTPSIKPCSISPYDALFPDMLEHELIDNFGAVVILNHTDSFLHDVTIEVGDSKIFEHVYIKLDPLLPYGVVKPAFPLKQLRQPDLSELDGVDVDGNGIYWLYVTMRYERITQTIRLRMLICKTGFHYKATKLSRIDNSAQYYAVKPPINLDPKKNYYLYYSLHGANVEALAQVRAYSPKPDGFIVAPTNRRPWGFDWHEWGRMDALETLELFQVAQSIDPKHIYLTGHCSGGHGVWYLGILYPSLFAAIGPSGGWIGFLPHFLRFQTQKNKAKLSPFEWAELENDALGLIENVANMPIYIIHGEKDEVVNVMGSRRAVAKLEKFHKDFIYHEEPDAPHWWDDRTTPGVECVNWIPLFEFFRRHAKVMFPLSINFKTPNPAISASCYWLTIYSQIHPSRLSSVKAEADPGIGKVKISTDNVERLILELKEVMIPKDGAEIQIDSKTISASTEFPVYLTKTADDEWKQTAPYSSWSKGLHRNGPFKLAFDKGMVWVYGTSGTDEENSVIISKVRYDSQVWWYRGNGNVKIVADCEFDPKQFIGRNIILYGNADTNSAFNLLLKNCPIQIDRHSVKIGQRVCHGDLGILFLYPRLDSDDNLIGVIGATSVKAIQMGFQARYFAPGVACPDYVLFGKKVLSKGMDGILEAGYFDNQWNLS